MLLNIMPGRVTLYILGCSISKGRKAGIVSALGVSTGCMVHTLMAALGLSVILAKSALAFNIIKYLGAGYLIYLGIRSFTSKADLFAQGGVCEADSPKKLYFQGITTNVLNPKVALFSWPFCPNLSIPITPTGLFPFYYWALPLLQREQSGV